MPNYRGKRELDIGVSVVGLILCFPLIILSSGAVLLLSGKNPFFIQERTGLHEKPFKLIKLKTLFSPENRVLYKTGLFLRKYSMDELPQFLNVLRGEMSLVGPRPLLSEYLPFYNELQRKRHSVKPGITGWAQINGRNRIIWEERFALDVWYVDNLSWKLDMRIITFTFFSLLYPTDVRPEGLSEKEKFRGSRNY